MTAQRDLPQQDVVEYLAGSSGLDTPTARRLVQEVIAALMEPVADYVRRRHRELRQRGLRNEEIFEVVAGEIDHRPFAVPSLSSRQLRRLVYG